MTHCLNTLPITRQEALMLFKPQRDSGGNLWGRGGSTFAVFANAWALKYWPRNVRGVRRNRGRHGTVRSPASLKSQRLDVVVRAAISHDSAHRDRTTITCRVDHVMRWRTTNIVTGGRTNADTILICSID